MFLLNVGTCVPIHGIISKDSYLLGVCPFDLLPGCHLLLSADYALQPPVSEIWVRASFQTLRRLQLLCIIHRDLVRNSQKSVLLYTEQAIISV